MIEIIKNNPAQENEIIIFLNNINFKLPDGFIEFYRSSNGAEIYKDENYCLLWLITELMQLNIDYNVSEYAPNFFVFGSNGGGSAFCIEKSSGYIYEIPFIGMSNEEAIFISKDFNEFIDIL